MPKLARPVGPVPELNELQLPSSIKDLNGRQLSEKLQEYAAWKAYVDQELGIATGMYAIVVVESRIIGKDDEDSQRAYGMIQAYMKRLEKLSDAFKIMYDSLSRQVTIRDQETRIQSSKRYT